MNKKITALPALGATPATDDVLPIVDVSGTATTKKVTVANLVAPRKVIYSHRIIYLMLRVPEQVGRI